jgi:hypothetical protein
MHVVVQQVDEVGARIKLILALSSPATLACSARRGNTCDCSGNQAENTSMARVKLVLALSGPATFAYRCEEGTRKAKFMMRMRATHMLW